MQASAKLARWLRTHQGGVAIIGASGWIGRAMAHVALQAFGAPPGDRLRLYASRAGTVQVAGALLPLETLGQARPLGPGPWLVAHLAVAGPGRIPDPDALRRLNEGLLADALALAGTGGARRLIVASSGAVYQRGQGSPQRQAYSNLKRDQEQIARAWSAKTGVPLLLPRIFNLGGPYMTNPHTYALGDFIRQAQTTSAIHISADRPVWRSYVDVLELAATTFDLAVDDAAPLSFDTAGAEMVEMAGLAQAVGRALGMPDLTMTRAPMQPDAAEDRYIGDGAVYKAAVAGSVRGLDDIVRDTASALEQHSP